MFDTIIRTDFVDKAILFEINKYCDISDFYINESYGGLPKEQNIEADGITDKQIHEIGLPMIPGEVLRSHRFRDMSDEIKSIASNINKMCEVFILEIYKKNMSYMQGGDFVRYGAGQSLPYHQDWTVSEWVLKHDLPIVHLSSVLYLNDNYIGGELLFSSTKFNNYSHDVMSIKPKAGTIIFFDALQWHASSPVQSGFKYASTNFYTLQEP